MSEEALTSFAVYDAGRYGGAEIARPDKTAPDQTARLNNGCHDYMTVL